MSKPIQEGTVVWILTPDNPRLDKTLATVVEVTEWGAYLDASAAATGQFRALHSEMEAVNQRRTKDGVGPLLQVSYSGDMCSVCGGLRLRRAGACLVCEDCGTNTGC